MSSTPNNTVADSVAGVATSKINDLLNNPKVPAAIKGIAQQYTPVITRMATADFFAFVASLQAGNDVDAMARVRAAMTEEELADEKAKLADALKVMASDSYQSRQILKAVLNVALTIALSAVAL